VRPDLSSFSQDGPGYALNFNGTNQYVSVPSSGALNLGSQFTLELWIFQTAALPANGYRLIDKETGGTQDATCSTLTTAPPAANSAWRSVEVGGFQPQPTASMRGTTSP
jgi:hypothetical protein